MICPHCGHEVKEAAVCEVCGKPIGRAASRGGRIKDHKKEEQSRNPKETDWLDEEEQEEEKKERKKQERSREGRSSQAKRSPDRQASGAKRRPASQGGGQSKRPATAKKKRPPEKKREDDRKKDRNRPSAAKPAKAVGRAAGTAGRTAGKAIGKGLSIVLKCGSFVLMAVIVFRMAKEFWAQSNVLGEVWRVAADKNYAEALYLGIAAVLLLYGVISALWILTGRKAADGGRMKSFDTGRGLTAFILFGILAFVAGTVQAMLPSSPDMIAGASLVLQIINGMKAILLKCCGIGIVLCIIRKFIRQ